MLSEPAKRERLFLRYTVLFAIGLIAAFLPFFAAGKTTLLFDDCMSAHYEMLAVRRQIWDEFWTNLLHGHRFAVPFVGWNLSADDHFFSVMGIEFTDLLFLFTKKAHWEFCFVLAQALRLWAAGAAFILYYRDRKPDTDVNAVVFSSLVYVFSGFGIMSTFMQPFFVSLLYWLPLALLGVERSVRTRKSGILIAAICGSAVCSLYLHYYLTIVLIPYCVVRLIREKPASFFKNGLRLAGAYLLGFGVSLFVNLHVILAILSSGKAESSALNKGLSYGAEFIRSFAVDFFVNTTLKNSTRTGITVLFLPALLYLFTRKGRWIQKIAFLAAVVLMNIPLWGSIAGITTTNNRWNFCLAFLCAYIAGSVFPEFLRDRGKAPAIVIAAGTAVWSAFLLIAGKGAPEVYAEAAGLVIACAAVFLTYSVKGDRAKWAILLAGFLIAMDLQMWFSQDTAGLAERGTVNRYLDSFLDSEATAISDDGFYRIDRSNNAEFFSEMNCNLPFWYGYNGISSFRNTASDSFTSYMRASRNIGFLHNAKIAGLDGRTTDEILACTGYYLRDENAVTPWGFTETTPAVWKNENLLPVGYTYTQTVSLEDYAALNPAEQQELLLKAAVVDEGASGQIPTLKSRELETELVSASGAKRQDDGSFAVSKKNAVITLRTQVPENCELMLELDGMAGAGKKTVYVSVGGVEKGAWWYGEGTNYSTRQTGLVFNLGHDAAGAQDIVISFPQRGTTIRAIRCYARDLSEVDADAARLGSDALCDVEMTTNRVSGTVDLPSDQWMVFSLTWSKGWHCFVDGAEQPLKKMNLMYMGLPLTSGHHEIELRYFPYGMKAGVAASLCCAAIWIALLAISRKRRGKSAQ